MTATPAIPAIPTRRPREPDTLHRRYLKLAVRVRCGACDHPIAVPRPILQVHCDACGHGKALPAAFWVALLEQAEAHYPELAWDFGHERAGELAGIRAEYIYGRKWPRCGRCDARLPAELADAERTLAAPCLECGAEVAGQPPPDWLVAAAPTAAYVLDTGGACFFMRLSGMSAAMQRLQAEQDAARASAAAAAAHPPCPRCRTPLPRPGARCPQCRTPTGIRKRTWLWLALSLGALGALGLVAYRVHRRWDLIQHSASRYADYLQDRERSTPARSTTTSVAARRRLQWRLQRVEHAGIDGAAADPCVLTADATRPAGRPLELLVALQCGGKRVFEQAASQGRTGLACRLHERPSITAAHYEYDLACETRAPGQPDPSSHAPAGAPAHAATAPSDKLGKGTAGPAEDPPAAARGPGLYLDTAQRKLLLSTRRGGRLTARIRREDGTGVGPALFLDPAARATFEPVRVQSTRVAYEGELALPAGTVCEVRVGPTGQSDLPCRARLQCGERVLYGGFGSGFCACHVEQGQLRSAHDDVPSTGDGDPIFKLSLGKGSARLEDDAQGYRLELSWNPTPR